MCQALLDELQPDIIITYGTLIIRPAIIAKAKCSMINMHTGLSPNYRGSDTIFWPLHNEEPEFIGVTIHRVDTGINSGAILRTAHPDIGADDDEHTLFAKAVQVGTPLLDRGGARGIREPFPTAFSRLIGRKGISVSRADPQS